jgi:hypothetical protein
MLWTKATACVARVMRACCACDARVMRVCCARVARVMRVCARCSGTRRITPLLVDDWVIVVVCVAWVMYGLAIKEEMSAWRLYRTSVKLLVPRAAPDQRPHAVELVFKRLGSAFVISSFGLRAAPALNESEVVCTVSLLQCEEHEASVNAAAFLPGACLSSDQCDGSVNVAGNGGDDVKVGDSDGCALCRAHEFGGIGNRSGCDASEFFYDCGCNACRVDGGRESAEGGGCGALEQLRGIICDDENNKLIGVTIPVSLKADYMTRFRGGC